MRIGLVVRGGVDRSGKQRVIPSILALVERLARRHDLHVFALHHDPEPGTYPLLGATIHNLGIVHAPKGFRRRMQLSRFMAALGRIGPFDLLHGYWAIPAGFVTTLAAERLGLPSIVTADSGEWSAIPDIQYGLQRRMIDRHTVAGVMRRATLVTVCTGYMANLAFRHGVQSHVIPLGVPPAAVLREGPDDPPWRLLHVASINPVKDHTTLLRAMAQVVQRLPLTHLDIVGADTLGGVAQQLAASLGLSAHVTFHGFQPTDALAAFYARAHLHVVSSRHEAAGVVILEAAAAKLPTVGTRVGYVADWAAGGDRAMAVPVADPAALAEAIVGLLLSPERRAQIAHNAHAWVMPHDADWSAEQFSSLYRDLVPGG